MIIKNAKNEIINGKRPFSKKEYRRKKWQNSYYEFHHILPKCLFPNWNKKESNVIPLTAREHFFCHQLLTKIYPGFKMSCALYYMINGHNKKRYKITSREYERIRVLNNQYRKGVSTYKGWKPSKELVERIKESRNETIAKMSEEERKLKFNGYDKHGENNPFYGKKHSKEVLEKISKTLKENISKLSDVERKAKFGHAGSWTGDKNPRARSVVLLNTGEI